jgi:prevent-host-death family protein
MVVPADINHGREPEMIERRKRGPSGFAEQAPAQFEDAADAAPRMDLPSMTATDAKNRFGELLEMARREPVLIQKNGRTVAVMVSPEEYQRMIENSTAPKVRPLVEQLLEKSIERRRSLYEALAK